ncbi:hypothetical protein PC129_g22418 [Phytophthora cactorum]|uniref:Uncharacterized protein n=2 Tax=Phytophthora cactorum TaxID=29920 RepID=A0A329RCP6_9STRA|nr:hypothetical protein Pcac1_g3027 [Phytophthora cactorum]KAG2841896.1 hypothetical protein PC112_g3178 [Phytophthora cactorum]KAG2882004.1 hypothetical protein PC114_g21248 [Phytophthora cactorum]KAG2883427.1 hypothetical protein PC117_g26027 [Phytophthora cactorum]KAG2958296.1 hypothetical protein PC118_g23598 [Phytophthora cactorum]
MKEADKMINDSLVECMQLLRVRDPMNIDELVCCDEENDDVTMEEYTTNELLSEENDDEMLESVGLEDLDEVNVQHAPTDADSNTVLSMIICKEKVEAIGVVMILLAEHADVEVDARRPLLRLQRRL